MHLNSMCALAFVPPSDDTALFDRLNNNVPKKFLPVDDFFELKEQASVEYMLRELSLGRKRGKIYPIFIILLLHITTMSKPALS